MKYRIIELLSCPQCGGRLSCNNANKENQCNMNISLSSVKCNFYCALKKINISEGQLTVGDCEKCYKIDIIEGELDCKCGEKYPIDNGVPIFVPVYKKSGYFSSFNQEWSYYRNWSAEKLKEQTEYVYNLTLSRLGLEKNYFKDKIILDAGCGSGFRTMLLSLLDCEVFLIDITPGAIKYAEELSKDYPFVYLIQGDVTNPPFKKEVFDLIWSNGVIHHTPSAQKGFIKLAELIRNNGYFYIFVCKV